MNHVRPEVGVSKCLEFDACRYNGTMISNDLVRDLKPFVDFIPVCPEVEIGLGTPRPTIVLQTGGFNEKIEFFQPDTGKVYTPEVEKLAFDFIKENPSIDGFIFKSKSPSCGLKGIKVYHKKSKMALLASKGVFAKIISEEYNLIALEEDGRLNDFNLREHFLIKLFSITRYREVENKKSLKILQSYHAKHKMLFYCYNQSLLRKMGKIASNPEHKHIDDILTDYKHHLALIFSSPPTHRKRINALMHMLGYFKEHINSKQKQHFLNALEDYRNRRIPAHSTLAIIENWLQAYNISYLEEQYVFEPFPKNILYIADSGKGVKL